MHLHGLTTSAIATRGHVQLSVILHSVLINCTCMHCELSSVSTPFMQIAWTRCWALRPTLRVMPLASLHAWLSASPSWHRMHCGMQHRGGQTMQTSTQQRSTSQPTGGCRVCPCIKYSPRSAKLLYIHRARHAGVRRLPAASHVLHKRVWFWHCQRPCMFCSTMLRYMFCMCGLLCRLQCMH